MDARKACFLHPFNLAARPAFTVVSGSNNAVILRDKLLSDRLSVPHDFSTDPQLGGHSLLAARVVARVNEVFHLALPLAGFYRVPTIADLAALIDDGRAATPSRGMEAGKDLARVLSMLEKF